MVDFDSKCSTRSDLNNKVVSFDYMAECLRCKKSIVSYPCPHCGFDGEAKFAKEGTTGGGQPGGD